MLPVETLTEEKFRPYGRLIRFPEADKTNFYIVASDEKPWRLAVFRYSNHSIQRMECHPTSLESFEPLEGTTLLLVSEHDTPEQYRIFLLDRPVILEKGVWHQTLSLTREASVKITENADVYSDYYDLPGEVRVYVG